jgi:4-hydroxybenzoate polyprenyltransferase
MGKLQQLGAWLAGLLFYGNIFIACCAVALLWLTYLQLGYGPRPDHLTGFVFFGTWFNYTLQRLISIRKVETTLATPLMDWMAHNRVTQLVIMAVAGVGVLYHLFFIWQDHLFLLVVIGAMALVYSLPVKMPGRGVFRIRELGLAKIFLVSIVWGAVTGILPASYLVQTWWSGEVWLIFLERALLVFALILPFDIRDRDIDRAYHLKTIPTLLGTRGTLWLGAALLIFMTLTELVRVWIASTQEAIPMVVAFALTSVGGTGLLALSASKRFDYFYYGMVDGLMLALLATAWCLRQWL